MSTGKHQTKTPFGIDEGTFLEINSNRSVDPSYRVQINQIEELKNKWHHEYKDQLDAVDVEEQLQRFDSQIKEEERRATEQRDRVKKSKDLVHQLIKQADGAPVVHRVYDGMQKQAITYTISIGTGGEIEVTATGKAI